MILKFLKNHYGLDLKSSDLDRPDPYASDMLNAQYDKRGVAEKRKGYRVCGTNGGGHGLFTYTRVDPSTGLSSDILLTASNTLSELTETTFTITYSGSADVAQAELYFDSDTDTYKLQLIEGTSVVLTQDLGKGFDEATPTTLAGLKTIVDAVSNFSSTITGTTSLPAALLSFIFDHDLTASAATATVCEFSNVNTTVSTPLAGSETNKNAADFENVSFAQLNNVAYVSNGYNEVHKYDGQTFYRAGLPTPTVPSTASAGAGSIAAGTYQYRYIYRQHDAVGNIVESNLSDSSSITLGSSLDVNVTVTNLQAGSGYNTNCAIVAGAQVTVTTITVDDGAGGAHTMKVGDTAYFYDSVSAGYVTREVTAVASGSITIAGAAVTVADNAVISNNLRIQIARSEDAGTFVFEVEEIPNNSFAATQVYLDSTADANLGIQVIEPIKSRGLPPKGKYLATYNNQLVIGGDPDNRTTWYWSDVTGPEYFPTGSNSEKIQYPVTGLTQSNEVMTVFSENTTTVYSGDFTDNVIRADIVSEEVGCAAHHTIKKLESEIRFLSKKGVYSQVSGQIPVEISGLIEPLFDQDDSTTAEETYQFKRAVAITDKSGEKYVCFIPTETTTSGDVHTNTNYILVVNDYSHNTQPGDRQDVWLKWRYAGSNPAGGMAYKDGNLYWVERRYSTYNTSVDHNLCKGLNDGKNTDYQDNTDPITWEYYTAWYNGGEPSVFKRVTRLKVYTIPKTSASDTTLTVNTEKDYTEGFTKNILTMDLSGAGGGYSVNPYGTSSYGDIDIPNVKTKLNGKFKSIRVIFSNSQDERNVELNGWELEVFMPYGAMIKE